MKDQITMQKHHHGYLVRWPATWEQWDWRTYREKYFETGGAGDESGYRKAQRHKRELINELKEFEQSIAYQTKKHEGNETMVFIECKNKNGQTYELAARTTLTLGS